MNIKPRLSAPDLFEQLDAMGIKHSTVEHPSLYTVEQSKQLRGDLPGAHSKNLFLRNKKGQMWLVTKATAIAPGHLIKFMESTNHSPQFVNFAEEISGNG